MRGCRLMGLEPILSILWIEPMVEMTRLVMMRGFMSGGLVVLSRWGGLVGEIALMLIDLLL